MILGRQILLFVAAFVPAIAAAARDLDIAPSEFMFEINRSLGEFPEIKAQSTGCSGDARNAVCKYAIGSVAVALVYGKHVNSSATTLDIGFVDRPEIAKIGLSIAALSVRLADKSLSKSDAADIVRDLWRMRQSLSGGYPTQHRNGLTYALRSQGQNLIFEILNEE